jgi:hypothetical protein
MDDDTDLEGQQIAMPRPGTHLPLSYRCPLGKKY